jgi:CheY-like chemotaxis protein
MSNYSPILYVEDEECDVLLLRLAMKRGGVPNPLEVAVDGVEAIDYLAGAGPFAERNKHPLPCLVLLDLKLPLKNGFEVLAWLRQQPQFAALPVVVYTSSSVEADRDKARELGATDYVVKKADVKAIAEWVRSVLRLCRQAT